MNQLMVYVSEQLMRAFKVITLLVLIISCQSKKNTNSNEGSDIEIKPKAEPIDNYSLDINLPVSDISILGTFHYVSNVDSYKRKYHLDVMAEKTQAELDALIHRLKTYKPTKILVEWPISIQPKVDSLYQEYRNGKFELSNNEVYQLGFRLANLLNHEKIYMVDAQAPAHFEFDVEDWNAYSIKTSNKKKEDQINLIYNDYFELMDSLKTTMPLVDYYRLLNSDKEILKGDQGRLSGLIQLGARDNYIGADAIAKDYRRNLRIYANILSLIDNNEDRFLLIIGSSHTRILKHLFEDSLELNYSDINDYLNDNQ
ncbi:DUF5694 domain-containing protein [uncultured Psychroserpens sp.]|uniref:DUF5694 domain-containing protein n=1 Tax=uncultured Psychroserpens sp. TaxID=255436 RepID=UPI00262CD95F|nr:DUF5694 domain-containing protein [uncultured Psychroserpens sp.]